MWLVLLNGKDCFAHADRTLLTNSSCAKPRGSTCFHKMKASAPTSCGRRTSRQSGFQQRRSSRNEKPVLGKPAVQPFQHCLLQRTQIRQPLFGTLPRNHCIRRLGLTRKPSRADAATLGRAISFLTRARVALADSRLRVFSGNPSSQAFTTIGNVT
jgi:hypothetical protein